MPELPVEQMPVIASRAVYVEAARGFLGVRWQHQGRSEQGIDCVGLLVVPALSLGLIRPEDNVADYSRTPSGEDLVRLLHQHCCRLQDWKDAQPADILAIRYGNQPQHVMIVTRAWSDAWGFDVIHSLGNQEMGGQVVEHRLDRNWLKSHRAKIHAAFQIKGVA